MRFALTVTGPAYGTQQASSAWQFAQAVLQTRTADSHHPLAVAFVIAPADDAAEQLAIEGFQFSNQALRRLMRETAQRRRRVQQTGQRHGVFFRQRGACDRRRQMPERRGGNQLRRLR